VVVVYTLQQPGDSTVAIWNPKVPPCSSVNSDLLQDHSVRFGLFSVVYWM
jgi:hypothetical protein